MLAMINNWIRQRRKYLREKAFVAGYEWVVYERLVRGMSQSHVMMHITTSGRKDYSMFDQGALAALHDIDQLGPSAAEELLQ